MGKSASRIGQRLGNYHIVQLLGEGDLASVYLGEHIHLGLQAAIKLFHTHLTGNDIETFRTEAHTIARLVHPHIVRVLGLGIESKMPFLVMDYVAGETLRQRHPRGTPLSIDVVVSYVEQAAQALQYAHDNNIVHQNIKLENMFLDQRQQVLLSDFSLAAARQGSPEQMVESVAGAILSIAPEQIQGKPCPASDQYALGIVVYEWLCGDDLFSGLFMQDAWPMLAALPPLREKAPTISPEIEQVVMTALARDPARRFADVRAFAAALRQASQARPSQLVLSSQEEPLPVDAQGNSAATGEKDHTPLTELGDITLLRAPHAPTPAVDDNIQQIRPKKRLARRTMLIAGLAGLVGVGAGLTWFVRSRSVGSTSSTSPSSPISSFPFSLSPSPSSAGSTLYVYEGHTGVGVVNDIAWSPDGRWIASASGDKTVQIWNPANGSRVFTYTGHSDSVHSVAWSPDGKRIASGSYDKTVQVWDAFDGGHRITYDGHGNFVEAVAWSPDGKWIAIIGVRVMEVWNVAGGQHTVYQRGLGTARTAAWSPDGEWIASGGGVTVYIWNAADGKQVSAYQGHSDSVNAVAWSPDGKRIASGGKDKTIRVQDAANGGHMIVYRGHSDYVNAVVWSPDGKRIASGANDDTVQVWNAADGAHIFTFRGHSSDVNAVVWSPDGKRIASGGDGGSVRVWVAP